VQVDCTVLGLAMGRIQKSMSSAHPATNERAMFPPSLFITISSSLAPLCPLCTLSHSLIHIHLCLSWFQLCRWSQSADVKCVCVRACVCGRERERERDKTRRSSMFWASGFSGVDAGGSWVKIVHPMLTVLSVV
jgi:hypothetical protein